MLFSGRSQPGIISRVLEGPQGRRKVGHGFTHCRSGYGGVERAGGSLRIPRCGKLFRQYKTNPSAFRPVYRMVAHTTYMIFSRKVSPPDWEVDLKET